MAVQAGHGIALCGVVGSQRIETTRWDNKCEKPSPGEKADFPNDRLVIQKEIPVSIKEIASKHIKK